MPDPLLPPTISRRLAAVLSGRSPKAFAEIAEFIERRDGRIPLAAVEQLIGAEITVEMYLSAQRRLDRLRDRERTAKRGRP